MQDPSRGAGEIIENCVCLRGEEEERRTINNEGGFARPQLVSVALV